MAANEHELILRRIKGITTQRINFLTRLWNALKRNCPVKTGKLRRSIRLSRTRGVTIGERYGSIQNRRGPHKGWIERSIREALADSNF